MQDLTILSVEDAVGSPIELLAVFSSL